MSQLKMKMMKMKLSEIKNIIREYNTIKVKLTQKKSDLVNALDSHLVLDNDRMKWKSDSPFKDERKHKKITDIVAVPGTDRTLKEKQPRPISMKKEEPKEEPKRKGRKPKPKMDLEKAKANAIKSLKKFRESEKKLGQAEVKAFNEYKQALKDNKKSFSKDKILKEFQRLDAQRK